MKEYFCTAVGLIGVPIPKVLARAVDILKQRSEEEQKGI